MIISWVGTRVQHQERGGECDAAAQLCLNVEKACLDSLQTNTLRFHISRGNVICLLQPLRGSESEERSGLQDPEFPSLSHSHANRQAVVSSRTKNAPHRSQCRLPDVH